MTPKEFIFALILFTVFLVCLYNWDTQHRKEQELYVKQHIMKYPHCAIDGFTHSAYHCIKLLEEAKNE